MRSFSVWVRSPGRGVRHPTWGTQRQHCAAPRGWSRTARSTRHPLAEPTDIVSIASAMLHCNV
eukprot:5943544-Pyramimonas_sp.AAC.1